MRRALGILVAISCSVVVFAQSSSTKPVFDAADVHIRAHTSNPNPFMSGGVLRGGRYDLRNATMLDLITTAYGVNAEAVLGGPNWLERDRFDVVAKAPQSTPPPTINLMLQELLAERFKLVIRQETKALPGFALTAGSGRPKMKPSTDGSGACEPLAQTSGPAVPVSAASCRNVTMESFAQQLRGMANAYLESPVVDATGLTGGWDFDLKWTQRALLAQAGSDGITISDAIERQLGLKLEPREIPQPVIVVASVNQRPIDNPSGAAQNLPLPPPAEFDVASVKLNPPGTNANQIGRLQPGGRVDVQNFPLKNLIELAWDINDDELLAAPKWVDDTLVSIVARTSATAIGGTADGMQIDIDDVRVMLQTLLVERFKMKTHVEDRPVTAFTLTADKPKLTKADPANRTSWKNGPAPNARDPRTSNPILARLVTCRNMSMAQFAEDLPRIAPGYIRTSVFDATGLEGNWDFSFNFSPAGVGQAGGGRGGDGRQAPSAASPTASDPTGAITLPEALNRQLGLKLEMKKRPLPVLVIDHIEEKPIDN